MLKLLKKTNEDISRSGVVIKKNDYVVIFKVINLVVMKTNNVVVLKTILLILKLLMKLF